MVSLSPHGLAIVRDPARDAGGQLDVDEVLERLEIVGVPASAVQIAILRSLPSRSRISWIRHGATRTVPSISAPPNPRGDRKPVMSGRLFAIAMILSLPLLASAAHDPSAAASGSTCPDTRGTGATETIQQENLNPGTNVDECDLVGVLVASDGLAVEIPAPGGFVELESMGIDTPNASLGVAVDLDGEVSYTGETSLLAATGVDGEDDSKPIPAGCSDDFYRFKAPTAPMVSGEPYYIRLGTIPGYLSSDAAGDAIKAGIRAWPRQENGCGLADAVDVSSTYGGNTTRDSAIYVNSSGDLDCRPRDMGENDTYSVMSFGATPGAAAATCRYIIASSPVDAAYGADIKFNSTSGFFTTTPNSSSCDNKYDLQSVATHEAGHYWGLEDIDAVAHAGLTMRGTAGRAFTCKTDMRSLGLGDVLGMRALY